MDKCVHAPVMKWLQFSRAVCKRQAVMRIIACFIMISGILFFIFTSPVQAGGLYLSQLLAPASLGTAGVANVTNNKGPVSAYTNPAGMTGLEQDVFLGGNQVLIPIIRFDSSIAEAGGSDGGNAGFVAIVPGMNVVKVLSDKFRLGFSVSAPLGGGVDYGKDFVGRYQATRSVLSGLGMTPSLAYRINDKVSVGVGVSVIYQIMDLDIAVNQSAIGATDGMVHIDKIDGWGAQGIIGLTWQVTDRALFGAVYRTKSETELEGDLDFGNIQIPILNRITSRLDKVEIDFDLPQMIVIGLAYRVTDRLVLMVDLDYEDWSVFSNNYISIQGNAITTAIDRNWDDTWHAGVAMAYKIDDAAITAGLGYDSSPVDDEDRTADLPADEQVKFGMAYVKEGKGKLNYGIGVSAIWLGDNEIDQVAQGARFKGEFDTNYLFTVGATLKYVF